VEIKRLFLANSGGKKFFLLHDYLKNSYVQIPKKLFYVRIFGLDLTSEGNYYKLRRYFSAVPENIL